MTFLRNVNHLAWPDPLAALWIEESRLLCKEYNLDPLRTIASGALLIVAAKKTSSKIVSFLKENGIKANIIGEIREKSFGIKIESSSSIKNLKYSAKDEISKIF